MWLRFRRSSFSFSLAMAMAAAAAAQTNALRLERNETLASYGMIETADLQIPLERGPGRLGRLTVRYEGTRALRLHFAIDPPAGPQSWTVRLLDLSGNEIWSYRPPAGEREFWSGEAQGGAATVEVHGETGDAPGTLRVDRVVRSIPPITPQAITEPDQRRPITSQPDRIRGLGRSVARLRFVPDDENQTYFCTGFLITGNLVMTNRHCIRTDAEARSALVDFDYDDSSGPPVTLTGARLLLSDAALDFSVLELRQQASGREPLRLSRAKVKSKQDLLLIEHPGGEPKQVSVLDCRVGRESMYGAAGTRTDFGHLCDTLGGSSGSPVLDYSSLKTIGLHHLGFTEDSVLPVNQAVGLFQILDVIQRRAPDVYSRLSIE